MKHAEDAKQFMAKAEQCLASAQTLIESRDPDGACNRAYYAMYDAAQAALIIALGGEAGSYKSHHGLIAAFGQHVVVGGHLDAEFGRAINEVQRYRQLADYTGEPIGIEKANAALAQAMAFVAAVQALIARRK